MEAFERVQEALDDCNCADVEAYTIESIEKLYRVPPIAKMAEAQYFVGKAKENAQKIITALDYCTVTDQGSTSVTTTTSSDNQDLTDLEKEQLKLKQQQEALIQKQKALKQQSYNFV